jgi:Dolichyl-phosphate-mannose-protein mannosyltransferase
MLRYILLIALTVRILLPIGAILSTHDPSVFYGQDSSSYIELAKALAFKSQFAIDGPEIFRTPGYPVFLIPGVLLNRLELTAIVLQIVISCLTVYFVYRIARTVFETERAANCGAILYALEPQSVLYSSKILSETLFTGLVVAFLLLFFLYTRKHEFHFLFSAGVLLSAATYVRPIAFYLPVIVSIFVFAVSITAGKSARWSALRSLALLAICGVLTGIWNVRNSRSADYPGFSSVSDYNLYFYQAASVLAAEKGVPYYTVRQQLGAENPPVYFENHPEQRQWTGGEVSRYQRREGMRVLLRHPFQYAEIHLKGMLRLMLDPGGVEYLKLFKLYPESGGLLGRIVDQGLTRTVLLLRKEAPAIFWSSAILGVILILYWLAASIGFWLAWRSYAADLIVMLTFGLYFVILSGGPNSLERFRHPVMPMVCLLAGYALSRLCTKNLGRS